MTEEEFKLSLEDELPPPKINTPLTALWWQKKGDWDKAHTVVQSGSSMDAAWVHALLHREEGDLSNANYWYRRAKQNPSTESVLDEGDIILTNLIS